MTNQTPEATDPFCRSAAELDALLAGAPWKRFAALGDSIVEGLGEPLEGYDETPWVERVARTLERANPTLEWRNFGRRYLRASEVREQQLASALKFEPDLACVFCGGNDLLTTEPVDLDAVAAELSAMLSALTSQGALVVTFTLQDIWEAYPELPEEPLRPRIQALNERVRELSERFGTVLVEQRGLPPVADRNLYSSDMLHPSSRGHAVVATLVVDHLSERLRSTTTGEP